METARETEWAFILTNEEIEIIWKALFAALHACYMNGWQTDEERNKLEEIKCRFAKCLKTEKASPFNY